MLGTVWMGWAMQFVCWVMLGKALLPAAMKFMSAHGLTDRNYRGESIPTSGGLMIWLLLVCQALWYKLAAAFGLTEAAMGTGAASLAEKLPVSLAGAASMVALAGFIDDTVGHKAYKGFAGHFRLWKERRVISTGAVKAGATGIAALWIIVPEGGGSGAGPAVLGLALQWLLIGLTTNAINLLDTRPGRALKGFALIAAVLLAVMAASANKEGFGGGIIPSLLPVIAACAVLAQPDLKGELMLGDTGSNLLGFLLGAWIALCFGWKLQAAAVLLLAGLHAVTWRLSLSKLIERNRFLQWVDWLGRDTAGKI
ncbi:Glycosyl transferase family 4 [Paenibacillus konkukensis]|uniref:Glycosyl transferase family 4 n=1 Tax=Paenibacillus konkukensis TaxID=2020716 RepID=A0ABY4RI28_9BACL|nr:hypothetical protein [Paenibacillus konkukensis]UQZ82032.1 Glycosyl transferase family 4 [Paenibacillus konkukensis]